jgi:hypothetical protein
MAARVVTIDLNGINPSLVDLWCGQGRLPTLARLRRDGGSTTLTSRTRLLPFSISTELSTGRSAIKTGLFVQSNQLRTAEPSRLKRYERLAEQQYWNVVCDAGRRAAVIDPLLGVPLKAPTRHDRTSCLELLGWSLHDKTPLGISSRPGEWLSEITRDYGAPRLGFDTFLHHCNKVRKGVLARELQASAEQKGRLLVDLLRSGRFDLVSCTFSEAHCGGHQLWHAPDALLSIYESLDTQLGQLMEAAGPDAAVLVVGTDAVGPVFGNGSAFIPRVLERLDPATSANWRLNVNARLSGPLSQRLRKIVPRFVKRALVPVTDHEPRAFTLFNGFGGALRLNLAGREPNGIVHPGAEAESIVGELTRALHELRLCGTDTPVVETVLSATEAFGDEFSPDLPDVLVVFRKDLGDYTCVQSDRVGRIHLERVRTASVTGENTGECHLWSIGLEGLDQDASPPDVLDVAPTVLALLGIEAPAWMDGRPMTYASLPS